MKLSRKRSRQSVVSLAAFLGSRLRAEREARSLRQDEIAATARASGLNWTQATVASIESGRRQVSLEELVLLPWIAAGRVGGPAAIELHDIFGGAESVMLAPTARLSGQVLEAVFRGKAYEALEGPAIYPTTMGLDPTVQENVTVCDRLWSGLRDSDHRGAKYRAVLELLRAAHEDKMGDPERKVARRLKTFPLAVAAAARKRWRRSFAEERDQRVAKDAPPDAPQRTLQAHRGHATRAMIEELRQEGVERLKVRRSSRKKGGRK